MATPQWIWVDDDLLASHQLALFRRTFTAGASPAAAVLKLSANVWYEAWLNGEWIGRGPPQSDLRYKYVDRFTVTRRLRRGRNLLAVMVYCTGHRRKTSLRQERGPAGLWADLTWKQGARPHRLVSDAEWLAVRPSGWRPAPGVATQHRGNFKEHIDARRFPADWNRPRATTAGWKRARPYDPARRKVFARLVDRDIPHHVVDRIRPRNAWSISDGMQYGFGPGRGWEADEPQALVDAAAATSQWTALTDGANHPRGRPVTVCRIEPGRRGFEPSLIADFGGLVYGRPRIDIKAGKPGRLRVAYGESLNFTYLDRFDFGAGPATLGPMQDRFFRYLLLTWRSNRPVEARSLEVERRRYRVDRIGTFACDDPVLSRAWGVGVETTLLNMHDHFTDCPFREHGLYWDDMAIQADAAMHAFGEHRLLAKCLRQGAWVQMEDGRLTASLPDLGAEIFLVDFPPHYIGCAWLHHWCTGDTRLLEELWPTIRRAVEWYRTNAARDGLLDLDPHLKPDRFGRQEWWCYLDWSFVEKRGRITALNALYAHALATAARIAGAIGRADEARACRRDARRLRDAIRRRMWSARRRAYVDCLPGGRRGKHAGEVTNALALWTDVADRRQAAGALRVLDGDAEHLARGGPITARLVEALFRHGRDDAAFARIDRYWGEMTRRGADGFWETFDVRSPEGFWPHKFWSTCHGWTAGILPLLHRYVLGVEATKPGSAELRVRPRPGALRYAEGVVPTVKGPVHVRWERKGKTRPKVRVRAPRGVRVV